MLASRVRPVLFWENRNRQKLFLASASDFRIAVRYTFINTSGWIKAYSKRIAIGRVCLYPPIGGLVCVGYLVAIKVVNVIIQVVELLVDVEMFHFVLDDLRHAYNTRPVSANRYTSVVPIIWKEGSIGVRIVDCGKLPAEADDGIQFRVRISILLIVHVKYTRNGNPTDITLLPLVETVGATGAGGARGMIHRVTFKEHTITIGGEDNASTFEDSGLPAESIIVIGQIRETDLGEQPIPDG